MTDPKRRKTGLIMTSMSLFMASPIVMHLVGYRIAIFNNIGLTRGDFAPWYAWIISLTIAVLYLTYTFKVIPFVFEMQRELSFFKLLGLLSIVGGVLEEVVFRHWLMDLLSNYGYSMLIQVLISGLLFGCIHVIWLLFGGGIKFLKGAFISTTILGFSLAILYLIGGRNVGPCIISHSLINVVMEPWLLLAATSKKWQKKSA